MLKHTARTLLAKLASEAPGEASNFEQSFSNLAHALLAEKAPTLMEYEQGFKIIDREDDGRKAVGVVGFKIGQFQLYVPLFFLRGQIKGTELMYVANMDMFVPLKEGWIDYIMAKTQRPLGRGAETKRPQMNLGEPDLNAFRDTPTKGASAKPRGHDSWLAGFMPKYGSLVVPGGMEKTLARIQQLGSGMLNFKHAIAQADTATLSRFIGSCQRNPDFAMVVDRHLGLDELSKIAHRAVERERLNRSILGDMPKVSRVLTGSIAADDPVPHPLHTGKLQIFKLAGLTAEQREQLTPAELVQLQHHRLLIKDAREEEETSEAYTSEDYTVEGTTILRNPDSSGLYEVLLHNGKFARCYIALSPLQDDGKTSEGGSYALNLDSKEWIYAKQDEIWCSEQLLSDEYTKWYDGLPDADKLPSDADWVMLINERGSTVTPLHVFESIAPGENRKSYRVEFAGPSWHCGDARGNGWREPKSRPIGSSRPDYYYSGPSHYRTPGECFVHTDNPDGSKLRSAGGEIWVPKGFKVLTGHTEAREYFKERDNSSDLPYGLPCSPCHGRLKKREFVLGDLRTAQLVLMHKTARVQLSVDGRQVYLNGERFSELDATAHLVGHYGLRKAAAEELLKRASAGSHLLRRPHVFRIKRAAAFELIDETRAPAFPDRDNRGDDSMGFRGPTTETNYDSAVVTDMQPKPDHERPVTDQDDYNEYQQQAVKGDQSGDSNSTNMALLGSLLREPANDQMIDQHIPACISGMDAYGQLLFQLYNHGDVYADRYGQRDIPELEDTLQNLFESVGDLVIFLKRKTVNPFAGSDMSSVGLETASA